MLKHHYVFVLEGQVLLCSVPFDTNSEQRIELHLLQSFNSKENLELIRGCRSGLVRFAFRRRCHGNKKKVYMKKMKKNVQRVYNLHKDVFTESHYTCSLKQ